MTNPTDRATPKTEKNEGHASPRSLGRALRERSLKAAGLSFLVADSALFTAGFMEGDPKLGAAGVFGLSEGLVGARYGNPKAEKQLELMYRRLGQYLQKEGVKIPKDPTTAALTKEGGVIDHIESFLYSYPSQVMNIFFSLIGASFIGSSMKSHSNSLFTAGCLLIGGSLGGLLIQEKKPDPDHPPHGLLEKAKSWVEEKPLRVTGTLLNLNVVGQAIDAHRRYKLDPAQKSYIARFVTVAAFAFGNTLMAISSKTEGGKTVDRKTLDTVAETSAHVIAAQPKETQEALLGHVAGYLSSRPNVDMKADKIAALLHAKLAEVAQQAQSQAGWQGRVADTKDTPAQPSL